MEKIFTAYADRKGVSVNALRFCLDGARIANDQTPKMVRVHQLESTRLTKGTHSWN